MTEREIEIEAVLRARAKQVVTGWFHEQWPHSTNLDPHVDCDYKKLTQHIHAAFVQLLANRDARLARLVEALKCIKRDVASEPDNRWCRNALILADAALADAEV